MKENAPGLPVLVKGISSVEDIVLAKQHGARGVFLSTHGVSRFNLTLPDSEES